jgi:hypothetical protein
MPTLSNHATGPNEAGVLGESDQFEPTDPTSAPAEPRYRTTLVDERALPCCWWDQLHRGDGLLHVVRELQPQRPQIGVAASPVTVTDGRVPEPPAVDVWHRGGARAGGVLVAGPAARRTASSRGGSAVPTIQIAFSNGDRTSRVTDSAVGSFPRLCSGLGREECGDRRCTAPPQNLFRRPP